MRRIFFILRWLLFSNLFFWLGHSFFYSRVARSQLFSDGRLDYPEFLAVFLLLAGSVLFGMLAALSFGKRSIQPEVRLEPDTSSDNVMDIIAPTVLERVEQEQPPATPGKRGDKRTRFREEIRRDVSRGGKS